MTLTLGRLSGIAAHRSVDLGGGSGVRLGGLAFASSLAEARAWSQQIRGLEGAVDRLISTDEPHLDGFYRYGDVSTSYELAVYDQKYGFEWSLTAIRVPHYQSPGFSTRSNQPERLNSTVTHTPWIGFPSTLQYFDVGSDASVTWYESRVGPGGTARFLSSSTYFDNDTGRGVIAPTNWYDMSPKLQVGGYTVVGDQIPALANLTNWQLDNGLVKFEDTSTSGCLFKMSLPDTGGTPGNWGTAKDIEVGYYDGTTWRKQTDVVGLRVLRNDAQEVGFALLLSIEHPSNSVNWEGMVTLRLRRGGLFAECHITGGRAQRYGIVDTSVGSSNATAFTNNVGYYQTSNDANGNQPVAMSFDTLTTAVLVDGKAYLNSAGRRIVLGLGGSLGSGASAPNRATDLLNQFGAGGSVSINVGS